MAARKTAAAPRRRSAFEIEEAAPARSAPRPASSPAPTIERPKTAELDTVVIRMTAAQKRRLVDFGLDNGNRKLQHLGMDAFNLLLKQHGLPPL